MPLFSTCLKNQPGAAAGGLTLDTPLPAGDAKNGQALFASQGCAACHSLKPDEKLVGPSLAGIATRAGDRIKAADYKAKATTGELYIRESIVQPGAYVMPGFVDGVMPQDYGKAKLSAQDLALAGGSFFFLFFFASPDSDFVDSGSSAIASPPLNCRHPPVRCRARPARLAVNRRRTDGPAPFRP
jgi:nitric oxide reductase subunit C